MSHPVTQQPCIVGLSLLGDVQSVSPGTSRLWEALGPISTPVVSGSVALIKTQEEDGEKAPLSQQRPE